MSLNIECEARVMLTEDQYHDILSHHLREEGTYSFIKQTNYYIDSDDFSLRDLNRQSLRIRDIVDGVFELTLKIKNPNGDEEYNQIITPIDVKNFKEKGMFPEGEVKNLLLKNNVDISKLKILASLYTLRYEEHLDDYLVVIDKNEYNGITDYNLEIEAPTVERANEVMLYYCSKYKIIFSNHYDTKSKRAIKSIKK